MKKIFLILITLISFNSFGAITVLPANLNGVNDTARCQHTYTKKFTTTGQTGTVHFSVSVGALPAGLQLDSITGIVGGSIGYSRDTSIAFTIRARQITSPYTIGTRAYTLYIRNTILTAPQLTKIWSASSNVPNRPNVYDTWYNVFTLPALKSTDDSTKWSINGNTFYSNNYALGSINDKKVNLIQKSFLRLQLTGDSINLGTFAHPAIGLVRGSVRIESAQDEGLFFSKFGGQQARFQMYMDGNEDMYFRGVSSTLFIQPNGNTKFALDQTGFAINGTISSGVFSSGWRQTIDASGGTALISLLTTDNTDCGIRFGVNNGEPQRGYVYVDNSLQFLNLSAKNSGINFYTGGAGTTKQVTITNGGDLVVLDDTKGVILKDNAGTPHYWRIQITSGGVLTTTDLGTTIP